MWQQRHILVKKRKTIEDAKLWKYTFAIPSSKTTIVEDFLIKEGFEFKKEEYETHFAVFGAAAKTSNEGPHKQVRNNELEKRNAQVQKPSKTYEMEMNINIHDTVNENNCLRTQTEIKNPVEINDRSAQLQNLSSPDDIEIKIEIDDVVDEHDYFRIGTEDTYNSAHENGQSIFNRACNASNQKTVINKPPSTEVTQEKRCFIASENNPMRNKENVMEKRTTSHFARANKQTIVNTVVGNSDHSNIAPNRLEINNPFSPNFSQKKVIIHKVVPQVNCLTKTIDETGMELPVLTKPSHENQVSSVHKKKDLSNHLRSTSSSVETKNMGGPSFTQDKTIIDKVAPGNKLVEKTIPGTERNLPFCGYFTPGKGQIIICKLAGTDKQNKRTKYRKIAPKPGEKPDNFVEPSYDCETCSKSFKLKSNLDKHNITHEEVKSYSCDVCSKSFAQRHYLKKHQIVHAVEKPFKCDICGKSFARVKSFQSHKLTHEKETPFKCDTCLKSFASNRTLKRHKIMHLDNLPFKCDVCGELFNRTESLKTHKIKHEGKTPFKCDSCDKSFMLAAYLRKHKLIAHGYDTRQNGKTYICNVCNKSYAHYGHFKVHSLKHNGKRPFKCDVCGKSFKLLPHLRTHENIHTGKKPFKCDVCGESFRQHSNLKRHAFKHTNIRPYDCNICGKSFTQSSHLKRHHIVHSGERAFQCDICKKSYKGWTSLKNHNMVHTGEKPHKCDVCDKGFTLNSQLKRHMTVHAGENSS